MNPIGRICYGPRGVMRAILFGAVLGALLTAAALYLVRGPGPRPLYTDVQVDSAAIVAGEPELEAGIVERILHPRVEPEVRATAPGAAAGDVAAVCLAAGYIPRSAPGPRPPGDAGGVPPGPSSPDPDPEVRQLPPPAAEPAAASVPPPSGLPPALRVQPVALGVRSAVVGRRQSEFWLPLSDGSLVRETYRIRPPYTLRVDGDSLVVRGTRGWWIRELAPLALCAAGAWGSVELDSPVPAAVGCGIAVAVELR